MHITCIFLNLYTPHSVKKIHVLEIDHFFIYNMHLEPVFMYEWSVEVLRYNIQEFKCFYCNSELRFRFLVLPAVTLTPNILNNNLIWRIHIFYIVCTTIFSLPICTIHTYCYDLKWEKKS